MELDPGQVSRGGVADVLRPGIFRVPVAQGAHQTVASHLGDDRGAGHRVAPRVAADDGPVRHAERTQRIAIDEYVVGLDRQSGERASHRQHRCLKDVEPIDLSRRRRAQRDRDRARPDETCQTLAFLAR